MKKTTCKDCISACKQNKSCEFFQLEEHEDGHCRACDEVMKWCYKCGGYHHTGKKRWRIDHKYGKKWNRDATGNV